MKSNTIKCYFYTDATSHNVKGIMGRGSSFSNTRPSALVMRCIEIIAFYISEIQPFL